MKLQIPKSEKKIWGLQPSRAVFITTPKHKGMIYWTEIPAEEKDSLS